MICAKTLILRKPMFFPRKIAMFQGLSLKNNAKNRRRNHVRKKAQKKHPNFFPFFFGLLEKQKKMINVCDILQRQKKIIARIFFFACFCYRFPKIRALRF